jgi:hypothetical protein
MLKAGTVRVWSFAVSSHPMEFEDAGQGFIGGIGNSSGLSGPAGWTEDRERLQVIGRESALKSGANVRSGRFASSKDRQPASRKGSLSAELRPLGIRSPGAVCTYVFPM